MSVLVRAGYVDLEIAVLYSTARFSSIVTRSNHNSDQKYVNEIVITDDGIKITEKSTPFIINTVSWYFSNYASEEPYGIDLEIKSASNELILFPRLMKGVSGNFRSFLSTVYQHPLVTYPIIKHKLNINILSVMNYVRSELADGKLKSYFVGEAGEYEEINANYWASARSVMAFYKHDANNFKFYKENETGIILVRQSDFEKMWDEYEKSYSMEENLINGENEIEIVHINKRGAPEKYDKVLFLAGTFNHILMVVYQ